MSHLAPGLATVVLFLFACSAAAPVAPSRAGPPAPIPVFAAGDARVGTAGFVSQTLRLQVERDGVRYTLMAFVVGDQLTLGAMVRGGFRGTVRWLCGARELSVPFDTAAPGAAARVTVTGEPGREMTAQGASFRDTAWTNLELPLQGWLTDGAPLQLTFAPARGAPIVLPEAGVHYCTALAPR